MKKGKTAGGGKTAPAAILFSCFMTGRIFDIQRFCVHDGPGIRTTVFMKGCPLRCRWCHNPEGLTADIQVQFFKNECIGCGKCQGKRNFETAENCPAEAQKICGRDIGEDELLAEVLRDRDFYNSEGGVTFSGGECLLQADFVAVMLEKIKREGVSTAVDTCGYVGTDSIAKTLPFCDLYLYDIKCADPELHKKNTGVDNRLILENLKFLSHSGKRIWIRVPVIPGVNDSIEEITDIACIVKNCGGIEKVTLMPYHTLGKSKYETLGYTPSYDSDAVVSKEDLKRLYGVFESMNIKVD